MAEQINITKKAVEDLPLPPDGKRAYYADTKLKGFQLAVTSKGTKTFVVYKKIDGKPTRIKLGTFPGLAVERARKLAQAQLGKIAEGVNPQAEKRRRAAERVTLAEAFEVFEANKRLKPKTLKDYRQVVNKALGNWKDKPLREITPALVSERHRELGQNNGEAYANLAMRVFRSIWSFAADYYSDEDGRSWLPDNPVRRLSKQRTWYRQARRQTYIQPHQMPQWFQAVRALQDAPAGSSAETVGDYLTLLILTGLRRSEAAELTWDRVDLKARTLTIVDTKNHEDHVLPLSDALLALLERRRKQADKAAADAEQTGEDRPADATYVFPGRNRDGFLKEPRPQVKRVVGASGVPFTLHDLRRTFVTVAEGLDIPAYALKRLLNHKMRNDVTAGYIVTDVERLRGPMQRVTDHILRCADEESADPEADRPRTEQPTPA
ncbi:MAG TPA: tyrosine-type recombinase/integrase [Gammaproteobacteria bacterium]|nr:tyrosine-type recombinase/integrase [Gammaproteobacteria bacterium]